MPDVLQLISAVWLQEATSACVQAIESCNLSTNFLSLFGLAGLMAGPHDPTADRSSVPSEGNSPRATAPAAENSKSHPPLKSDSSSLVTAAEDETATEEDAMVRTFGNLVIKRGSLVDMLQPLLRFSCSVSAGEIFHEQVSILKAPGSRLGMSSTNVKSSGPKDS